MTPTSGMPDSLGAQGSQPRTCRAVSCQVLNSSSIKGLTEQTGRSKHRDVSKLHDASLPILLFKASTIWASKLASAVLKQEVILLHR